MKILQVTPTFYPALDIGGGVPRVAYELSRKLKKYGNDVTIFTTDVFQKNEIKNYVYSIEGMEVYYFPSLKNVLSKNKFYITPELIKVIKKELPKFDVIHLHDYRSFQNTVTQYYAKKYDIPYVLQPHGSLTATVERKKLKKLYDITCGQRILSNAKRLIALNESEKNKFISLGLNKNKIEIVPNGVDLSQFKELPPKGTFRLRHSIPVNDLLILYLGRLHKSKNIDLLLDAFYEVIKTVDAWLILMGPDGGYRQALEAQTKRLKISNKVIFTGTVNDSEKLTALADANVFATPNFSGFPLTFLEACACSLPLVTTNHGDMLSWIDNNVGYVTDYDKFSFCEAIIEILKNKNINERFGNNGKSLVYDEFNWDKISKRILSIYLDIISV